MTDPAMQRLTYVINLHSINTATEGEYLADTVQLIEDNARADYEVMLRLRTQALDTHLYELTQGMIQGLQARGYIVTLMIEGACDESILALTRLADGLVIDPHTTFSFNSMAAHPALNELGSNPVMARWCAAGKAMTASELVDTLEPHMVHCIRSMTNYLTLKGHYTDILEVAAHKPHVDDAAAALPCPDMA